MGARRFSRTPDSLHAYQLDRDHPDGPLWQPGDARLPKDDRTVNRRGYPWIEIVVLTVLAAFLLRGAATVPFHPDELSWLFQSRDLETLLTRPTSPRLARRRPNPPPI